MYVANRPSELEGTRQYVSTGKEADPLGSKEDLAYWMLSSRINDTLGGQPATIGEIYYSVTRPLGMSSSDTARLVTEAKKKGYIRTA